MMFPNYENTLLPSRVSQHGLSACLWLSGDGTNMGVWLFKLQVLNGIDVTACESSLAHHVSISLASNSKDSAKGSKGEI
jgi:hypothetical protein